MIWNVGSSVRGLSVCVLMFGALPLHAQRLRDGELARAADSVVTVAGAFGFSGQVLSARGGEPILHRAYGHR